MINIYNYLNDITNLTNVKFLGNDKDLFNSISWNTLNNILETSDIREDNILLLKNFVSSEKKVLLLYDYLYIINKCLEEFSVYIKDINLYDFELNKLFIEISNKFNFKISLDIEIGMKNSNAHNLKKKIQNVLVYQKYGSSIWEVCKKNNKMDQINFDLFSNSMIEFKLNEGDLLYIPSNFYRRKIINSENYMFIYLNIYPINSFLILNTILRIVNFDNTISLPLNFESYKKQIFIDNLRKSFKEILENDKVRNLLLDKLKIEIELIDIKKIWNIK